MQASGEALLAAAKLLKWKELKHLLERQQTRRIGKCLVRTCPRVHESCPAPKVPTSPAAALSPQPVEEEELHPCDYPQGQSPKGSFPSLPPLRGRALGNDERWQEGLPQPAGGLWDMPIPLSPLQLVKDKRRAEEDLHQSLPYLRDSQATV